MQTLEDYLADNLKPFLPFAYFDKYMDCVRVQIVDCSVTEVYINRFFSVMRSNHEPHLRNVGFVVNGVAHLFNELGLDVSRVHNVVMFFDRLVKKHPDLVVNRFTDCFACK